MAKFYVQCGPIETVLIADSAEQAAMAAINRSLQSHLWIYDDPDMHEADCRDHLMLEALLHLAPSLLVSEQGFDRSDAIQIGTPDTILLWHKLMISVQRMLAVHGLPPRNIALSGGLQGGQTVVVSKPR